MHCTISSSKNHSGCIILYIWLWAEQTKLKISHIPGGVFDALIYLQREQVKKRSLEMIDKISEGRKSLCCGHHYRFQDFYWLGYIHTKIQTLFRLRFSNFQLNIYRLKELEDIKQELRPNKLFLQKRCRNMLQN